ncbi:Acetylcholine receptor subunit alpha-type unc-38 [Trichinella pseudospiralis]|uniref:Acetylcholine receptor subunit alpha-type unc-38 n=1 Tax=Trichinella pseudospiralis TaxID=6337 RepID=A0A0V1J212_TRIPS|nr:Acetylcholine receptor subunit alpha-type unc-38 [Trichinella pseudospiralis]
MSKKIFSHCSDGPFPFDIVVIIGLLFYLICSSVRIGQAAPANENAKRLFDDLLINYNKLRRPVKNPNDILTIKLKLRLSQIIDVHEKDQIMTTSVWLKQEWIDNKLIWDPQQYGGLSVLYVPAEMIWLPDIVLYNNAASNYNITITTKATLHYTGLVRWEPPAIYKSMCSINVEWFPFDEQTCHLKFGSWSYTEAQIDLQHMDEAIEFVLELDERDDTWKNITVVWNGIEKKETSRNEIDKIDISLTMQNFTDLSDYYPSVEWDILSIPAKRHGKHYNSCCASFDRDFIDITYYINLRRKPLFYTVNMIFPCIGISFLTILVFYLPSDSNEKISLCISILVSLTVFFLLLTEIIPATSIVLPLIGKYLLFTMVMVTLSVIVTVVSLNLHFRTPTTHRMPKWVKRVFLRTLPKYLLMRRPLGDDDSFRRMDSRRSTRSSNYVQSRKPSFTGTIEQSNCCNQQQQQQQQQQQLQQQQCFQNAFAEKHIFAFQESPAATPTTTESSEIIPEDIYISPPVVRAFRNVCFIARLLQKKDRDDKIDEDWKYVAMVLDRLFLWIFAAACFFGTVIILLQAPSFYDNRVPLEPRLPTTQNRPQHV